MIILSEESIKEYIIEKLDMLFHKQLTEMKQHISKSLLTSIDEAKKSNNIVMMGRVQKVRRRIRRNKKGRMVLQKNIKRSAIKGYKLSGNTVKRIPAAARIKKARLLKRSWKTTRKAKLRRSLIKRKLSIMRRKSMGIR